MLIERVTLNRSVNCAGQSVGTWAGLSSSSYAIVLAREHYNCKHNRIQRGSSAYRLSFCATNAPAIWLCDECAKNLSTLISNELVSTSGGSQDQEETMFD